VPLSGRGQSGFELLLGLRLRLPLGPMDVLGAAGPGFFGEGTTPSVRAYLSFAFANLPMTQPPCVEKQPYALSACPGLDSTVTGCAMPSIAPPPSQRM
jgi:hypothetical protein